MVAQISNPDVILVVEHVMSAAKVGVFRSFNYQNNGLVVMLRDILSSN